MPEHIPVSKISGSKLNRRKMPEHISDETLLLYVVTLWIFHNIQHLQNVVNITPELNCDKASSAKTG